MIYDDPLLDLVHSYCTLPTSASNALTYHTVAATMSDNFCIPLSPQPKKKKGNPSISKQCYIIMQNDKCLRIRHFLNVLFRSKNYVIMY